MGPLAQKTGEVQEMTLENTQKQDPKEIEKNDPRTVVRSPLSIEGDSPFMAKARIGPFEADKIPPCTKPDSFNNDLNTGAFTPSKFTWGGEQKRGILCHVTDSKDIPDHVRKAVDLEFFLGKDVPLPHEIKDSLEFLRTTKRPEILKFWEEQLAPLRQLVTEALPLQQGWGKSTPQEWGGL